MSDLQKNIKNFSDEYLLNQYTNKSDEYTEKALSLMREEIVARNLSFDQNNTSLENEDILDSNEKMFDEYPYEDFESLPYSFYQKDILLAREIITEAKIPGIIKPVELIDHIEENEMYSLLVPKKFLEKAQECICTHFDESEGRYRITYSDTKDRLKSFVFNDVHFTEIELDEEISVEFNKNESAKINLLIERLIKEADRIEKTGTILFYFDNLEKCSNKLSKADANMYSRADLLTIIEVLQIFCDETVFPDVLFNTANALLDFISY